MTFIALYGLCRIMTFVANYDVYRLLIGFITVSFNMNTQFS